MSGYIGTQPVPQATQTRDSFTCTAGQTSFATSGYTPNFLDVYLNGVKLTATDYTASNGSDVVLASGAATGDVLEVVAYTPFEAANVTGATDFTVTGSFTSQGIDDNATSTAMTLDTSGNVGIGTSSPARPFSAVSTGSTTAVFERTDGTYVLEMKGNGTTSSAALGMATNDLVALVNGAERMRIDSSGAVTMPTQPAFLARPSVLQSNIPNLTETTVNFGTEVFDQNSDFSSNTFTAPVTGKYQLNFGLRLQEVNSASSYYHIYLKTSNRSYPFIFDPTAFDQDAYYWYSGLGVLADMDAGDTAYVTVFQAFGTAQMDIHQDSYFSGYLAA